MRFQNLLSACVISYKIQRSSGIWKDLRLESYSHDLDDTSVNALADLLERHKFSDNPGDSETPPQGRQKDDDRHTYNCSQRGGYNSYKKGNTVISPERGDTELLPYFIIDAKSAGQGKTFDRKMKEIFEEELEKLHGLCKDPQSLNQMWHKFPAKQLEYQLHRFFLKLWEVLAVSYDMGGNRWYDSRFIDEYIAVMRWVEVQMLEPKDSAPVFEKITQVSDRESQKFGKLQNKIIEFLLGPDLGVGSIDEIITKHAKGCQLGVYVIGSYFKTMNPQKWHNVFFSDQKFMEMLARRRNREVTEAENHVFDEETKKLRVIFEKSLALPWQAKNEMADASSTHTKFSYESAKSSLKRLFNRSRHNLMSFIRFVFECKSSQNRHQSANAAG